MGIKKVLQSSLFGALNPKKWLGYDSLKQHSTLLGRIAKNTLSKQQEGDGYKPKSFEDCMRHYGVSEEDLEQKMQYALCMTYFCLGFSVLTFSYMFYQFFHNSMSAGIMCLILTGLLWAMALREHFNLFQMRQRRLGCSFKEWFYSLFKK